MNDDEADMQIELIAQAIRECAEEPMTAEDWAEALYKWGVRVDRGAQIRKDMGR